MMIFRFPPAVPGLPAAWLPICSAFSRPCAASLLLAFAAWILALGPRPAEAAGQEAADVAGSWVGGELLPYERPDSQVLFITVRPDGSLAISMIYEVGPRSRLWTYDIDVTYEDGAISWAYHQGGLNPARDTMRVLKDYNGDRSEWMWVRRPGMDSLMARIHQLGKAPFELSVPPDLGDGWPTGAPEAEGLAGEAVSTFLETVSRGELGDIHSLLVARRGTLVIEEYFAQEGSKHGTLIASTFRNRVHHLASTTKAVVSALVGIAVDRGYMESAQDPIARYLPDHASLLTGGKEAITVQHLLTMSPGLQWLQRNATGMVNDGNAVWQAEDVVEYTLRKRLYSDPGTHFNYSNGSAAVVGRIMENATGKDLGSFARENLFRPLDITDFLWTSYPDGTIETDGGLALRPRDLAKIGQLYLDGGRWGETQVLSSAWVEESTTGRFRYGSVGDISLRYGYFWMEADLPSPEGEVRCFFHSGDGGQFLMVIPELEMVVVFTGGIYGRSVTGTYLPLVVRHLLSTVAR